MRFYTRQHRHYCGVDLHARSMYVCVLDRDGNVLVSKNIPSAPEPFLELIAPYREDLAVAAECMFTWYWLADLCAREGIVFVLGHALYMRAIHGVVPVLVPLDLDDEHAPGSGWTLSEDPRSVNGSPPVANRTVIGASIPARSRNSDRAGSASPPCCWRCRSRSPPPIRPGRSSC